MRIIKTLGAAFLSVGTVGVVLVFADYNDNNFSYRADGMIMINGEVFFPVGVYCIPCPERRQNDELIADLEEFGRGFLFEEFAANGGNFVLFPCFHTNFAHKWNPPAFCSFEHYMPCDLTDYHDPEPEQCTPDLTAAEANGIKILTCPNLGYYWYEEGNPGEPDPYAPWIDAILSNNYNPVYEKTWITEERDDGSRANYFNTIKTMVENSGAEAAFFGWWGFQEPPWLVYRARVSQGNSFCPRYDYVNQVYQHVRELEANANANHPFYLEECRAAIVADLYRQYHEGCDILCYNITVFPTPRDPGYDLINNKWASVHGDAADMHFWSVDGAKPVICCVDAIWRSGPGEGYFPWDHQVKFMTYDAVIHRVNGLVWGMFHYVFPVKLWLTPYWVPGDEYEYGVKPTLRETGLALAANGVNEVLKAPFDDTMVEAIVKLDGAIVERTAFVGGDLAPKNQFLSSSYLLEGCVKLVTEEVGPGIFIDFVYLITANRSARNSITHEPFDEYEVKFKPYFSGYWAANTVTVVNEDRTINVVNGTFTDTFMGEDVHIYKFTKPPRFGES
jgi:hypothetical protein